jgi:predicted peroxiredoxin
LRLALAAAERGHDVRLWLAGEGVRLGVKGVAETLKEPGSPAASEALEALAAKGARFLCSRPCFLERQFEEAALRAGARLADFHELADEVAGGRTPVPT